jgi:hypothetical protein
VDARAIIHWAARSAGLELGELVNARECLNAFDISKVPRNLVRLTRETYAELGL